MTLLMRRRRWLAGLAASGALVPSLGAAAKKPRHPAHPAHPAAPAHPAHRTASRRPLRHGTTHPVAGHHPSSRHAGHPRHAAPVHEEPAQPLIEVPRLAVRQRTLANGLQVLSLQGGGSGSVAVQVWYRVGAKDDPAGRSGFAHLFEHLMFKGTRYLRPEQFDRLTEDVGGQNNAFTAEDVTVFESEVPANRLESLLWAEAERMSNLDVSEANFKSERAVVEEEFRQTVLADPYGRLFDAIAPYAYSVHPYKRPVIGRIEDLEAATLDDVRAFHDTYYRPDNAVLIVTGDFDPAQLDTWVDRYFGPLSHPAAPVPRVQVAEPVRTASRSAVLAAPNVPLPALMLIWQGPRADHPDAPALTVAQALLAGGDSARLNQALVYRERLAQSVGFDAELHTDAGALVAYAIAAGTTRAESLLVPLMREIAILGSGPVRAAELDKAKTQLLTAALVSRQSAQGLGEALGWATILHRDPLYINRDLDALQAVTGADVARVVRQYLLGRPRVVLQYVQQATDRRQRPTPVRPSQPEAR